MSLAPAGWWLGGALAALELVGDALLFPAPEPGALEAQYVEEREFHSPVSGEPFLAYVLARDAPVVSWDYDRCPHPPFNTLAYTLVIDPVSGYVAPAAEFGRQLVWDAADLGSILGEPRFSRDTPPGLPWAGAYPWERHENAALLAAAEQQPAHVVGNWWLLAAWSVRLDVVGGHNEFDQRVAEIFAQLPRRGPDPGDVVTLYELQLAAHWEKLHNTGQLPDVPEVFCCLALAWLYRSRGELLAAESWLRSAALSDAALPAEDVLYRYLMSSIELERHYLRQARRWLVQAWNDAEFERRQESGTAFILAEINRRLGEMPAAVYWYDIARDTNMGMLSSELIKRQRALADGGRGY
jgi:hypothetical protein